MRHNVTRNFAILTSFRDGLAESVCPLTLYRALQAYPCAKGTVECGGLAPTSKFVFSVMLVTNDTERRNLERRLREVQPPQAEA